VRVSGVSGETTIEQGMDKKEGGTCFNRICR